MWERRKALADAYRDKHGTELALPPEPIHPLMYRAGDGVAPGMSEKHAKRFVRLTTKLPILFGLESRPTQADLDDLAEALSDYSRHHPEFEGKAWDTINLVIAAAMVVAPWWGELRAKKNGTWDSDVKPKFRAMGLLGTAPELPAPSQGGIH